MPELRSRHLCTYRANLASPQQAIGKGHFGQRTIAVVTGGHFKGDRLSGKVLNGGGDWATIDEGDTLQLDARVTWETDDGALIYLSYRGILKPLSVGIEQASRGGPKDEADAGRLYFRTNPIFETGDERYR